jgi:hypothetical protein
LRLDTVKRCRRHVLSRKGSGVLRSTVFAVVSGIVVGTSFLVHDFRAREAAQHAVRPCVDLSGDCALAAEVDPQSFIPGFDPEAGIDVIQEALAEAVEPAPTRVAAPSPKPTQVAKAAPAPEPRGNYLEANTALSLSDLEALKRELMSYADQRTSGPSARAAEGGVAEGRPGVKSTVSGYFWIGPSGPTIVLFVEDEFGIERHEWLISPGLSERLQARLPLEREHMVLLFVQHLYRP